MGSLKGQLLLAMPGMEDPRFERAVVFICSHSSSGAMGFALNKPVASPSFTDILSEIGLKEEARKASDLSVAPHVFSGGPVEQGRGFVLHSLDYSTTTSSRIDDLACITATMDILRALANARGPERSIMLLGYAGWGAGQLEAEIAQNGWLTAPATRSLLFETDPEELYVAALAAIGVSVELLSADAGHA